MSRAAVVWLEGERLRSAALDERTAGIIGRGEHVAVPVTDRTVSRHHARVRFENGAFIIEQLSAQNPTRVSNRGLGTPVPLADKTVIEMGALRLVFHDLQAADQVVYQQLCGFCKRDNSGGRKDCWYCGTSLSNAPTVWVNRRSSRGRLVVFGGETYDLYDDETYGVRTGGAVGKIEGAPPADAAGVIEVKQGQLRAGRSDASAFIVNGAPASSGQQLNNGDLLDAGAHKFLVLVR